MLPNREWYKSTYTGQGNCVEVADDKAAGIIAVRDSKDQQGPELTFPAAAWTAFTASIKDGTL
jgi:hypothetical protein